MPNKLTDNHIDELEERGYVIVHDFLDEGQRQEIAAAVRKILKPWNEIEHDPPEGRWGSSLFPFPEPILNDAAVNRDAIQFAQKWFRTDHIHFRPRSCLARYPGFKSGANNAHLDNGNNSLLPPTDDRTHKQIWFWIHPEPVAEGQAPLRLVAHEHEGDIEKAEPLICEGGTLCIFHTHTWHSASDYIREDGQRYTGALLSGTAITPGKESATTRTSVTTPTSENLSADSAQKTASYFVSLAPGTRTTRRKRWRP